MRFGKDTDGGLVYAVGAAGTYRLVLAVVGVVILVSCLAAGAAARTDGGAVKAKPVLRIALAADPPDSHNPAKVCATGHVVSTRYSLAYAPILNLRPDGSRRPGLATSWGFVKSKARSGLRNKVFEFTLRRNGRFSDGTPVTAQAVANWLAYYSKNSACTGSYLGPNPKFQAVGRWKVRITTAVPTPDLPYFLGGRGANWGYVVSPAAVARPEILASRTAGAGPYMLDPARSVRGDHYTYVPNPYYYDKAAQGFSRVEVRIVTVASSRLQALQAGQVDIAEGDPATAAQAERSGFSVASADPAATILLLDGKHGLQPALRDRRVRQAMNYAIDRKTITRAVMGKYGRPTAASPVIDAGDIRALESSYAYNPTRAKQLLAQSSYPNGFTLKIMIVDPAHEVGRLVQAAAKYLDAIGIKTEITVSTYAEVFTFTKFHAWPGYTVNTTSADYNIWYNPKSGIFFLPSEDRVMTRLFHAGLKAANPAPIWHKMWVRANQQAYHILLATWPVVYFMSNKVGGVVVDNRRSGATNTLEWFPK